MEYEGKILQQLERIIFNINNKYHYDIDFTYDKTLYKKYLLKYLKFIFDEHFRSKFYLFLAVYLFYFKNSKIFSKYLIKKSIKYYQKNKSNYNLGRSLYFYGLYCDHIALPGLAKDQYSESIKYFLLTNNLKYLRVAIKKSKITYDKYKELKYKYLLKIQNILDNNQQSHVLEEAPKKQNLKKILFNNNQENIKIISEKIKINVSTCDLINNLISEVFKIFNNIIFISIINGEEKLIFNKKGQFIFDFFVTEEYNNCMVLQNEEIKVFFIV